MSTAGASSGTIESSASMAAAAGGQSNNNPNAALSRNLSSFMNSSNMGSNIMNSGAEHSIVSFGLNFNFDSTSSPSNSDSGEGAVNDGKGGGDAGSSGEDDDNRNSNNNNGKMIASALKNSKSHHSHRKHHHKSGTKTPSPDNKNNSRNGSNEGSGGKASKRSNEGRNSKGSSSKHSSKAKKHASVKFSLNGVSAGANPAAAGEDGFGSSTSSGSDSGMNDDSGGSSGGSNSGNDGSGSSGGKSTISSLTTSSNQEWMATNESNEAAAAAEGAAVAAVEANNTGAHANGSGGGETPGEKCMADGTNAANNNEDSMPSKKRKKVSLAPGTEGNGNNNANNGAQDDDGYKTDDEEQWGGDRNASNGNNHQMQGTNLLPPAVTHKGSVLRAGSLKKSNEGPPVKQARFSIDQHPANVQSADASAQPLSSLSGSDSAGVPAVTNSSMGHTLGLSNSSATANAITSSNPSSSSGVLGNGMNISHPINMSSTSATNLLLASLKRSKGLAGTVVGQHPGNMDPDKRKERNAREKQRSCRIARQIDDLRALLSRGGVIVSKGTKSSVLSEAANYINLLQQQQVQWEMDRQALMQQMQQLGATPSSPTNMGQGQMPQNDMSMGQGQMPINDMQAQQQLQAMGTAQPQNNGQPPAQQGMPGQPPAAAGGGQSADPQGQQNPNAICPNDYKFIFDNSSVGMAIASLGGAFIDCNSIFCQLSEFTREEVCAMTIFNMTSRQDLQHAFDLISQMITPNLDNGGGNAFENKLGSDDKSSIVLRGAMKTRSDLGLSISLIKGDHGIAKCFCVTLVRILSMETTRPDTVSIEMELPQVWSTKQQKNVGFGATPAYTAG